jgi:GT2 family glycosyltransferase
MTPFRPRIAVVILNWNGATNTLKCVEHVFAQTVPPRDVLVIDNGSTDDSVSRITSAVSTPCTVTSLPGNVGFAEGMNVGIRAAMDRGADYVWLLNNDAFAAPDCLERLATFMEERPTLAIATPRLVNPDGTDQHVGGIIDWRSGELGKRTAIELCGPAVRGTWLTGAAPLVRLSALRVVGCFDSSFFAYWEDVDLSIRLFVNGGDLRALPDAVVEHVSSSSTGGSASPMFQFLVVRNEWLFTRKNYARRGLPGAFARFAARSLEHAGSLKMQGHSPAAEAVVSGMVAIFLGRYGHPRTRTCPSFVARVVVAHPWKLAFFMRHLADWSDRIMRCHAVVRHDSHASDSTNSIGAVEPR